MSYWWWTCCSVSVNLSLHHCYHLSYSSSIWPSWMLLPGYFSDFNFFFLNCAPLPFSIYHFVMHNALTTAGEGMWMMDTERGLIWLTSWHRTVPLDKASPRSSGSETFSRDSKVWPDERRNKLLWSSTRSLHETPSSDTVKKRVSRSFHTGYKSTQRE